MRVGYCVPHTPAMASYRFRVAIPAPLLGCEYEIGCTGNPSFFYKHFEGDLEIAKAPFVYDVVNDHFTGKLGRHYRTMCARAEVVTVGSESMAETVKSYTGRDAVIIDDPWENEERTPACEGPEVLWFGHAANMASLVPYVDLPHLVVCSNIPNVIKWTPDSERRALDCCAVVLVTGTNPGASSNRIVKALRHGRFVVTPGGVPAWDEFAPYIWVGDVREGIKWALNNREEACQKILKGQEFVRERNSPARIAAQWMEVFGSTLAPATSDKRDGSALT